MYKTDVLIIGAGAVGCALARELSKFKLDVMVCDKNDDVGGVASKSNSGLISTSATMALGTLENRLRTIAHNPAYFPEGEKSQKYAFDFFNYSGIHRPVRIYTTPVSYIKDVTVVTDICGSDGIVDYRVVLEGAESCEITLLDEEGVTVAQAQGAEGKLRVPDAKLWQVRNAYLYQLDIRAGEDHYTLPIGIRTVRTTETQLLINGKPVYLKGFGKHEDSDIKGKGLDEAINVRDFELLKWIGANSIRTSHYPYSEELIPF